MKYRGCLFYTLKKKIKAYHYLPIAALCEVPLSLSLTLYVRIQSQCITYTCCETDKLSDSLTVRKGVQPQLPTQNKLPPCSGHSSDLKISLESCHSLDIKISLQRFHSFKTDFHNCTPSPTCLSVAMEISRMPLLHFEKKMKAYHYLPIAALCEVPLSLLHPTSAYKANVLLIPVAKRTNCPTV